MRAGRWDGVSVTLPHKHDALVLADRSDPRAARTGAANCLVRGADGKVVAHNTDVDGVVQALAHHGVTLGGTSVLLLGAGGAARAAAAAARDAGATPLWIANRHPTRALTLASAFDGEALPLTAEALAPVLPATGVVPLGCVLHDRLTVMDMVYRPLRTRLLRDAESAGARTVDGLWMLVFQGLAQLRLWTGVEVTPEVATALHQHLVEGG